MIPAIAHLQKRSAVLQSLESEVNQQVTFHPKTNRLSPARAERVANIRRNYDLAKEHVKSPIKDACNERARRDAAEARRRVQEFLERNSQATKDKEIKLEQQRQVQIIQEEAELAAQYHSSQQSQSILQGSEKLKDLDLLQRQELFLEEKRQRLQAKGNDKEEEKVIQGARFQRATDKKKSNTHDSVKIRRVDQSAKTAHDISGHHLDTSGVPDADRSFPTTAQQKRNAVTRNADGSFEAPVEDFSRVLVENDAGPPVVFQFQADEEKHRIHETQAPLMEDVEESAPYPSTRPPKPMPSPSDQTT